MKILQICHKPPSPPVDGGCLAAYNLSLGILSKRFQLHILAMETHKHPAIINDETRLFYEQTDLHSVYVDTQLHPFEAMYTIIRGRSYHVQRFHSEKVAKQLKHFLLNNTYGVIILESLFATPYLSLIRKYSCAKVILRQHNIEYTIWDRLATSEASLLKRLAIKLLIPSLKKYELKVMKKVDAIFFISEIDKKMADQHVELKYSEVLPFGIDLSQYKPSKALLTTNFFHIGSMSWLPNREGIAYFLNDVFPSFLEKYPEAKFVLAGRETQDYFGDDTRPGLACVGEVADAKQFIAEQGVMIVPLLSGSGVRIKIIEAMALGKAVITTSIGAEGLAVTHGVNIMIADTQEEWMNALESCYQNPDFCVKLGQNARTFIAQNHNNDAIIDDFLEKIEHIKKGI